MEVRNIRPIIAALVGIGIVVLVIVLLIKAITGGGGTPAKQINLVGYANSNATAELYMDGPINSDQEHKAVKIIVGQTQTEIDILQGYEGTVTQMQAFPNNTTSYANFLRALQHLNFTKGDNSAANQDERGFCAQENRYIYIFNDGNKNVFRYWATTCGQGTFGGNRAQVRQLFERQIPEKVFDQLTAGFPLS